MEIDIYLFLSLLYFQKGCVTMNKSIVYKDKIEKSEIRVRRLVALIIDWYLTSVFSAIPITFFLRESDALKTSMFDFSTYDYPMSLFLVFYGIVIFIIYYIIIPVYIFKGQTLGKKICGIQVIKEDFSNITLKTMLIREILGQTIIEGGIVISSSSLRQLFSIFGYAYLLKYFQYLAYALTVISIIFAFFQPYMQCFHDKMAKTVIIKLK